jgi:hypothetical protein
MLRKQDDGWYYPDVEDPTAFQERSGVFAYTIGSDFKKFIST